MTLPDGWVEATLADLIAHDGVFTDGDWIETKDQDPSGDVRLAQLADVGEGVFRDRSSRFLRSDQADTLNCTFLQPGDVLVARMPDPLGRACLVPDIGQPAVTAVDVCIVRPGSGSVDSRWLMWAINSPQFRGAVEGLQTGTTRKRISRKNLASIDLPVPPLAEQRRIVAAIEEHFSRLDAAERILTAALAKLKRFERACTGSLLGGDWTLTTLGELALKITKGTTPTSLGRPFTPEGVLFVKAESLALGVIDHDRCAHIDGETDELLARSRLEADDLLITIAGTLGRVGVVRLQDLPANTNQAVSLVRLRDRNSAGWVATWLRSSQGQLLLTTGGRGVGLQNLNLQQIRKLTLPLPPREERERIVAAVARHLSLVHSLNQTLKSAQKRSAALRRAILEQAFRGELVRQEPDDAPASVLLERVRAERAGAPKPVRQKRVPA